MRLNTTKFLWKQVKSRYPFEAENCEEWTQIAFLLPISDVDKRAGKILMGLEQHIYEQLEHDHFGNIMSQIKTDKVDLEGEYIYEK